MSGCSAKKVKRFFEKYWYIGIILILLSAVLSQFTDNEYINKWTLIKVAVNALVVFCDSLGAGMIIGYCIDMVRGTDDYIDYTQERLKEILISKDFISELSQEEKSNILLRCLPCSVNNEHLRTYITHKADQLYKLSTGHLRSDIDYVTTAKKDRKRNVVVLQTKMSYKIYRIGGKYQPIIHSFDKETSRICSMEIIAEGQKPYKIDSKMLHLEETLINQKETAYINEVEIPTQFATEKSLTLKIVVEEDGYDHWGPLIWMSLYPTNRISYKIICNDGLIVKHFHVFDQQDGLYYVEKSGNELGNVTSCIITCDTWTDPYTGFSIVISEP